MRNTNPKAPHYVVFSTSMLPFSILGPKKKPKEVSVSIIGPLLVCILRTQYPPNAKDALLLC